jgi:hypothetical protein
MHRKEDVNLLVPFGYSEAQPEREALLHFVVEKCVGAQTYPNIRTVLVESSNAPTQAAYAKQYCDEYVFIPLQDGMYSPAIVQNEGFLRSTGSEFTYIHQADFILPPEMVERSLERMKELSAPVIFPFFSSVNLSKPLTEAVTNGTVDWKNVLAALEEINVGVRQETHEIGIVERKYLTPDELSPLVRVLPPDLQVESLLGQNPEEIWGINDGNFTYFGDSFRVVQPSETLLKYRPGGRAKGSYLTKSTEYDRMGGSPSYVGWGYEDLGFWARAQALYDYKRARDGDMYFGDRSVSTNFPIIHLWHSTTDRADYFAMMDENKRQYEAFIALTPEQQRRSILPLGK